MPGRARPSSDWEDELRRALALAGDHLSLYQLTLERGTPFYAMAKRGSLTVPPDDESADMFEATQEITAAAGLVRPTRSRTMPGPAMKAATT